MKNVIYGTFTSMYLKEPFPYLLLSARNAGTVENK
jgi:hypothetical protein